jgi:16S rRNA (cytidine1402-2'-O)-methyltransferase
LNKPGTLYLIPTQLADPFEPGQILPTSVIATARRLDFFVAENAKSARAFLKAIGVTRPLSTISIHELDKHAKAELMVDLLAPLLTGNDMGLVSEAGAPAVADPGALVVAAAHAAGARVAPLVGPSSLLLGLMASGLNGQNFAFHGYLPQEKSARCRAILDLERESRQRNMTQLFIETPYRNQAMYADLLLTLAPATRLCIASNLTGLTENVRTRTIFQWRGHPTELEKSPTLFLILA